MIPYTWQMQIIWCFYSDPYSMVIYWTHFYHFNDSPSQMGIYFTPGCQCDPEHCKIEFYAGLEFSVDCPPRPPLLRVHNKILFKPRDPPSVMCHHFSMQHRTFITCHRYVIQYMPRGAYSCHGNITWILGWIFFF